MAKTIDEILDNIRTVLKEENSELANFPEYGNLYIIFRSLASVISEQDSELDSMYDSLFINTSNDKNLDQRAKEYGLERQKGTKAYGSVIVENSLPISGNFNTKIKRGTILLNPFTNKQYMVLKDVSLVGLRTLLEVESLEEVDLLKNSTESESENEDLNNLCEENIDKKKGLGYEHFEEYKPGNSPEKNDEEYEFEDFKNSPR